MALYHRKFLLDENDEKPETDSKYASHCYMCYVCPEDCSKYLSPPPPPPPPSKDHEMSIILILMLCVLGAAFLFLSYLTIYKYRSRTRNSGSTSLEIREDFIDEDHGPVVDHPIWYIRTVGLPQSVIDSIEVFKFKKGEGLIDCSVCLSEFEEDESLRLLPKCSHAFHVPCIDTWLRSHMNCPVCRAPVLMNTDMDTNTGRVDSVDTGSGEENRTVVNESESDETRETRGVIENMVLKNSRGENVRVFSDLVDHYRMNVDQELQVMRRSLSMDFSSSSMICTKKDEGCSDTKLPIIEKQNLDIIAKSGSRNSSIYNRLIKSSSHGRSIQKGPISMKRSFSFSGKRSLRRHSKSMESITIPEASIEN